MSVKIVKFNCHGCHAPAYGCSLPGDNSGNYVLHSDYAALLASHNALCKAVHKAMERTVGCDKKQTDDQLIADVAYLKRLASDYFKTSVDCGNRAFAAEQKYDALRDAVAWEREFDEALVWLVKTGRYPRDMAGKYDLANERECARAEVDRLIGEVSG